VQKDGPYAPTVVPFMYIWIRISSSQGSRLCILQSRKQSTLCTNHGAWSFYCKNNGLYGFASYSSRSCCHLWYYFHVFRTPPMSFVGRHFVSRSESQIVLTFPAT